MKKHILILLISSCLYACSDSNSITCTRADWVGTYVGTEVCAGVSSDATITITAANTADIVIEIDNSSATVTLDAIPADGCNLSESFADQGLSLD